MNNKTQKKIEKLRKAYEKFEKRISELKAEEHKIVNEAILEIEEKEIKETMKKIDQIKD